ncbi:phospholipase D-like domain-containing protein [Sphingomonas sp. ZB1N12]
MIKWMRHKRIHTKLDGHHPTAASHHQKIVIIDDALALMEALHRRDTHRRLRMYHPYTKEGAPIYCHAKILIAADDDDVFRLGSSNVNNRSLRLDTECDLAVRAKDAATSEVIAAIRDGGVDRDYRAVAAEAGWRKQDAVVLRDARF